MEDGPLPEEGEPAARSRGGSRRRRSGEGRKAAEGGRRGGAVAADRAAFRGTGGLVPATAGGVVGRPRRKKDAEEVEMVGEREPAVVELGLPLRDEARERGRLHQVFEYEVQARSCSSLERSLPRHALFRFHERQPPPLPSDEVLARVSEWVVAGGWWEWLLGGGDGERAGSGEDLTDEDEDGGWRGLRRRPWRYLDPRREWHRRLIETFEGFAPLFDRRLWCNVRLPHLFISWALGRRRAGVEAAFREGGALRRRELEELGLLVEDVFVHEWTRWVNEPGRLGAVPPSLGSFVGGARGALGGVAVCFVVCAVAGAAG